VARPADYLAVYSDKWGAQEAARDMRESRLWARVRVVTRTVSAFGSSQPVHVVAAWERTK
jgi:hypothetical protein